MQRQAIDRATVAPNITKQHLKTNKNISTCSFSFLTEIKNGENLKDVNNN